MRVMKIGRKILNLRRDRGVAQRSLAEMTSVTPSALSRIEAGIHQPKGPVALRIARVLGVSADYILDESAPYPPPLESLLQPIVEEDSKVTIELHLQEKKILDAIRRLSPEERSTISDIIAAGSRDLQALRTLAVKKGLLIEDDE